MIDDFILYIVDEDGNKRVCIPMWFSDGFQRLLTHNLSDYKLRRMKKRRKGLRKAK